jgi:transketolase
MTRASNQPVITRNITPYDVRRLVLEQSKRANVGHVGSALSIADLVAALYERLLKHTNPDDPDRDRVVVSKGHAVLAVYAAMHLRGWLDAGELDTYCADDSLLGVHPERALPGVDFSTGSLGQGLAMGAGAALAARLQRSSRRAFVLLSDAECDEGSVWESAIFAAHHRLSNLVAVIDLNGQQALGYTRQVLSIGNMAERWRSFGWDAHDVDGTSSEAVAGVIEGLDFTDGPPHCVVAHTVFGRGVSFMERRVEWHYLPMSDEQFELAMSQIALLP